MLEWRDLLLTEGGTDRDREVESGIQHKAATFGARLQAAGPRGLQPMESAKPRFKVHGCDINSLTLRGTKTRSRQNSIVSLPDNILANDTRSQRTDVPSSAQGSATKLPRMYARLVSIFS